MASTISTCSYLLYSSPKKKSTIFTISSSLQLYPRTSNCRIPTSIHQLGHGLLSPWNGLRHLGISLKQKSVKIVRKDRNRGKVVYASLFGVGAPEALVIGVVALLVFGPKGLAEVARNLGKTLRAFQPTIRELQDVSREFKNTLEKEIGLDDISPSAQNTRSSPTPSSSADKENSQTTLDPNGTPLTKEPYSTEEYLKVTKEQLEASVAQPQLNTQEETENKEQQDGSPATEKPFNIGELLVEAQMKSTAAQKQAQAVPQETQAGVESQPKEVPTMSPPQKPESESEM
ncbi:Sec-independent protein translocase protein tatb protein [Thalictrum thalictroides]|uniref:Sec-independent protein translocase protein tatb protein n=1 Tax=Thalictrum thalictroides TaxID=46969 RepID=A0A7J6V0I8_THATH|nr:Sec-independent protein translocase protein tatb protein [Thalictrum thalictroides]